MLSKTKAYIERARNNKSLDELINDVLHDDKFLKSIDDALQHPAIIELIKHLKLSAKELQARQNQLSEYPTIHAEEIRNINALRKVTEQFVTFFDIPEQIKKDVSERKEHLYRKKTEAELHDKQTSRF